MADKTQGEVDQERRLASMLQRPVKSADGGAAKPIEQLDPRSLWAQAESITHALADVSNHCRRTANDLEQRLMELERMLGSMPKRT